MGIGRASDDTLGVAAMTTTSEDNRSNPVRPARSAPQPHGWRVLCALALCTGALAGCNTIGGLAGAAAGIATGSFTANPAVALGVGIGVQVATDEASRYVARTWHAGEQDAIASVAGSLDEGGTAPWAIKHAVPIGNAHGDVRIVRVISTPLTVCKEALFSVVEGKADKRSTTWFTTQVCQQGQQWRWAAAEPAVDRWGTLQ